MKTIALAVNLKGTCHPIHRAWVNSVGAEVKPFLPLRLMKFSRRSSFWLMLISALYAPFLKKADVYILDGIRAASVLFFKRGKFKVISINSDTFFSDLEGQKFKGLKLKIISRIDAFISTSNMVKSLADKYMKRPNIVVYPFADEKFLKVKPNLVDMNICAFSGAGNCKASDIAIDIFASLSEKHKDTEFYLIGESEEVHKNRNYYEKMKKIKNLKIIDFTENLAPYFSKCGIILNCSRHDSFGVGTLEGMMAGLIPIVTETCGIKEIINDKKLVCKVNSKELVEKIDKIMALPEKTLVKMSEEIKLKAKKISKKNSISSFSKTFSELVDDGQK